MTHSARYRDLPRTVLENARRPRCCARPFSRGPSHQTPDARSSSADSLISVAPGAGRTEHQTARAATPSSGLRRFQKLLATIELGIANPATPPAAPVPCPVDPVAGSAAAVHTVRRASRHGSRGVLRGGTGRCAREAPRLFHQGLDRGDRSRPVQRRGVGRSPGTGVQAGGTPRGENEGEIPHRRAPRPPRPLPPSPLDRDRRQQRPGQHSPSGAASAAAGGSRRRVNAESIPPALK